MDGQLCYQADVDSLMDEVVDKKKAVFEGLMFLLDYNKKRMVDVSKEQASFNLKKEGPEDIVMYIGTIGKNVGGFAKNINMLSNPLNLQVV